MSEAKPPLPEQFKGAAAFLTMPEYKILEIILALRKKDFEDGSPEKKACDDLFIEFAHNGNLEIKRTLIHPGLCEKAQEILADDENYEIKRSLTWNTESSAILIKLLHDPSPDTSNGVLERFYQMGNDPIEKQLSPADYAAIKVVVDQIKKEQDAILATLGINGP